MSSCWLIILSWHGKEDTLELLATLRAAELPDTQLLVIDNGSFDGVLEAVRQDYPDVDVLQTGRNLGFAGGNNFGIRYAMERNAEVIGILNNDTRVHPSFWPPLVATARQTAVAVSPDIRYANGSGKSWFFGGVSRPRDGRPRHLQDWEQPSRDAPARSQILTGCCLVARADTWRRVGGFDEGMFLIFEDADWSLRAASAGVDLWLDPRSLIEHKVSSSLDGPANGLGTYYFCRNGLVFARRWLTLSASFRFWYQWIVRASATDLMRMRGRGARSAVTRWLAFGDAVVGVRGPASRLVHVVAAQPGSASMSE